MNVAIIPARGGSKRIPKKNVREFCGKPMIAWPIEAAFESGCFDEVVVSTDSSEIANVARRYGAAVPFLRPDHLSDDHTGTMPVVQHAIGQLLGAGRTLDSVCCLYATAPFVTGADLKRGLDCLRRESSKFAFSITSYAFPIQRALRLLPGNRIEMLNPDQFSTRSQDLEEAWHDAGQFYWGTVAAWQGGGTLFGPDAVGVAIPRFRVQDIDTPEDWLSAEYLFEAMRARGGNV